MSIYLELFLVFLEVGAFSFGGGYGMISMIREKTLAHGWLTEAELLNMIAVAESTPGPIAVNMATFVGSSQGGILGSLLATFGVVLPSFVIILIIAALIKEFMKFGVVKAALVGIRPAITAMILATAATMLLSILFSVSSISDKFSIDIKGTVIFAALAMKSGLITAMWSPARKPFPRPSPPFWKAIPSRM
jgi:chromate transporter